MKNKTEKIPHGRNTSKIQIVYVVRDKIVYVVRDKIVYVMRDKIVYVVRDKIVYVVRDKIVYVVRDKIDTSNIRIHERLLYWLGTGTSMK